MITFKTIMDLFIKECASKEIVELPSDFSEMVNDYFINTSFALEKFKDSMYGVEKKQQIFDMAQNIIEYWKVIRDYKLKKEQR